MKANELRIGNWILTCNPGQSIMIPHITAQVQGITLFNEIMLCHTPTQEGFSMPVRHTLGIKITPEWLERLGFVTDNFSTITCGPILVYSSTPNKYCVAMEGATISTVQYIHELQNIYFAITGEELALKS